MKKSLGLELRDSFSSSVAVIRLTMRHENPKLTVKTILISPRVTYPWRMLSLTSSPLNHTVQLRLLLLLPIQTSAFNVTNPAAATLAETVSTNLATQL
jgi:hypothetical protein